MLSPIILFVYNRPEHTLKTLMALKENKEAAASTLYIFADGPKENASAQELNKVAKVRKIIKETESCGKVVIKERDTNIGLATSVINGVTEIINKYGKAIVLEDDIVCSPFFLEYMNFHLDTFEEDENIFGVSGFSFAKELQINKAYLLPILSSWGWATWKDRWAKFENNASKLLPLIKKEKFDFGGYPYYQMLNDQINGVVNSWAIRFYAVMFLQKKYFIYPPNNLILNIGFDNSGEHCDDNAIFDNKNVLETSIEYKINIEINKSVIDKIEEEFRSTLGTRKMSFIKRIINYTKNVFKN